MEKRTTMEGSSDSLFGETEHELEVADILLNFAASILKSECSYSVSPSWGATRKRTPQRNSSSSLQLRSSPPLLPSPVALPPVGFEVKKSVEVNAVEAPSPSSILLFPPAPESSESDEKSNLCLPRNSHKIREELVEEIEGLNQFRDLLREEVEKVKSHYDRLVARNTQLKSLRQQVFSCVAPKGVDHQLKKPESSFGSDLSRTNPIALPHQHLLHIHPTAMIDSPQSRESFQFITTQVSQPLISSGNRMMVPYVNPDLSISFGVDPAQTWEYFRAKRAKYAEARMYRKNRKNMRALRR